MAAACNLTQEDKLAAEAMAAKAEAVAAAQEAHLFELEMFKKESAADIVAQRTAHEQVGLLMQEQKMTNCHLKIKRLPKQVVAMHEEKLATLALQHESQVDTKREELAAMRSDHENELEAVRAAKDLEKSEALKAEQSWVTG